MVGELHDRDRAERDGQPRTPGRVGSREVEVRLLRVIGVTRRGGRSSDHPSLSSAGWKVLSGRVAIRNQPASTTFMPRSAP
jgi:hypothetical protein